MTKKIVPKTDIMPSASERSFRKAESWGARIRPRDASSPMTKSGGSRTSHEAPELRLNKTLGSQRWGGECSMWNGGGSRQDGD